MKTQLVCVALDDERLSGLARMSEATGLTVEEIVQAAVSEFLADERHGEKLSR